MDVLKWLRIAHHSVHGLRHTAATLLIAQGLPAHTGANILGLPYPVPRATSIAKLSNLPQNVRKMMDELGVPVLDHLILSDVTFLSLKERGLL